MKDFKAKDLRKAAFAVGFGLYFGQKAAKFLGCVISNAYEKTMVHFAKDGNEFAQAVCKGAGVDFSNGNESEDFDPDERVMGFRA